ncbi:MAG: hypothetical protein ABI624_18545, partial [Casimicrobiaceae bacterium]
MSRLSYGLTALSVIAALGAGTWFWLDQSATLKAPPPAPPPAAAQKPSAPSPALRAPVIANPIEAAVPVELPPLAEADAFVSEALVALLLRHRVPAPAE